ncbi:MAG: 2-C-methyl-D-erythritol 4-phosphate cytidylyltransferase [Verrucomicrobiales bacterium]|nr:2-C-methyl-D-erythritol 4-phosphate cytidylyltransferase [Verrucomicrobiales bacterium]
MANVAVIVAAGSSRRMGFDKLTALLRGQPVLAHSLRAFQNCEQIDHIVIVAASGRQDEFQQLAQKAGIDKLLAVVAGGEERSASSWNGVRTVMEQCPSAETIMIHDGARPLITSDAIRLCLACAQQHGAATLARPVTDTLKRADENDVVTASVSRENLWRMETPQAFAADLIVRACRHAVEQQLVVTDEVSAVQDYAPEQPVHLVDNPCPNPKITVAGDLALAEALIDIQS